MNASADRRAAVVGLPACRLAADGRRRIDVRAVLVLAAPLMASNAVQAAISLTDLWFIGRLSTDAVAAISAIYWIITCLILIVGGVGLSVQTFVSQAHGSRRSARAGLATWCALWATLATLPLFVLLAYMGPWLLRPFGLPPQIEQLALEYWEPRMLGAALGSAAWAVMGFFNGIGATRFTMAVVATMVLVNFPANQMLMFTLDLGMTGAAWGTNVAQLIGLGVAMAAFLRRDFATRYRTRLM
jgi:multidrug resistance protein, MATE family